jgi:predicted protein tyrosine phosphatase
MRKTLMKALFVCNQNQNRSKTAEMLFSKEFETKSAGLYTDIPLNKSQLKWADVVVVMEDSQRTEISKRFPKEYLEKKIVSLNIPDTYYFNQPELVKILKSKLSILKAA